MELGGLTVREKVLTRWHSLVVRCLDTAEAASSNLARVTNGSLAQMGERHVRNVEAASSILARSKMGL